MKIMPHPETKSGEGYIANVTFGEFENSNLHTKRMGVVPLYWEGEHTGYALPAGMDLYPMFVGIEELKARGIYTVTTEEHLYDEVNYDTYLNPRDRGFEIEEVPVSFAIDRHGNKLDLGVSTREAVTVFLENGDIYDWIPGATFRRRIGEHWIPAGNSWTIMRETERLSPTQESIKKSLIGTISVTLGTFAIGDLEGFAQSIGINLSVAEIMSRSTEDPRTVLSDLISDRLWESTISQLTAIARGVGAVRDEETRIEGAKIRFMAAFSQLNLVRRRDHLLRLVRMMIGRGDSWRGIGDAAGAAEYVEGLTSRTIDSEMGQFLDHVIPWWGERAEITLYNEADYIEAHMLNPPTANMELEEMVRLADTMTSMLQRLTFSDVIEIYDYVRMLPNVTALHLPTSDDVRRIEGEGARGMMFELLRSSFDHLPAYTLQRVHERVSSRYDDMIADLEEEPEV